MAILDRPALSRLRLLLSEPELAIAQLILWGFVALTALQVTMRYAFNAPLTWPEELSQILLVWMTFISAVGLSRKRLHIRVELLDQVLGPRGHAALEVIFNVLTLTFMAYLVLGGIEMFEQLTFERTPALRLKLNVVYLIVPVSAALIAMIHLRELFIGLRQVFGGSRNGP